jgi:hypothetical protein
MQLFYCIMACLHDHWRKICSFLPGGPGQAHLIFVYPILFLKAFGFPGLLLVLIADLVYA